MRRIITMTLMSLGLTGGVALADNHVRREPAPSVRDHRGNERGYDRGFQRGVQRGERREERGDRREERVENRGYNRVDRDGDERPGFRFIAGAWQFDGHDWHWVPGHYVRAELSWGY